MSASYPATPALSADSLSALDALAQTAPKQLYVFGYASLIWRPGFSYEWCRPALAYGWRRDLCLISTHYRGTPKCPGLVCGLDSGGSCKGVVYSVAMENRERVLRYLWKREMFADAYRPIFARCELLEESEKRETSKRARKKNRPCLSGKTVRALTFAIRHDHPQYGGGLSEAERLVLLRQGRGSGGTSRDYLEQSHKSLAKAGLSCPRLEGWLEKLNRT